MSLKRLCISTAAAALLAVGVAACGGDTETVTEQARRAAVIGSPASGGGNGKKVKMIASVPPTDHGWLGAVSKNAKKAAEAHDDLDFELLQAADADSQAQQVEQAIAKKPDVLVVLPQDGAALTPVARKAEAAGIPVVNIDRLFTTPGCRHRPRCLATTTRSACWRPTTSRTSSSARATWWRSRAWPASR